MLPGRGGWPLMKSAEGVVFVPALLNLIQMASRGSPYLMSLPHRDLIQTCFCMPVREHFLCSERILVAPLDCPGHALPPLLWGWQMPRCPHPPGLSGFPAALQGGCPSLFLALHHLHGHAAELFTPSPPQPVLSLPSDSAASPLWLGLFSQPCQGTRSSWPDIHLYIQPLQLAKQAFTVASYPLKCLSSSGDVLCPHVDKQE